MQEVPKNVEIPTEKSTDDNRRRALLRTYTNHQNLKEKKRQKGTHTLTQKNIEDLAYGDDMKYWGKTTDQPKRLLKRQKTDKPNKSLYDQKEISETNSQHLPPKSMAAFSETVGEE